MMEKLDWKASSTRAKSIGTLVTIAGALIMSLYKGQAVINNNPPFKLFPQKLVSSMQFDWAFGALLLAAHSCFLTISYILALINANLKHLLAYFQRQTWLSILILLSLLSYF